MSSDTSVTYLSGCSARDSDLRGLRWPNGIATSDDNALHDIGRQTLRNDPSLAESPREPVIARRLGLNKVHDLSATEARVPRHRCAAERGQDALGHHRLEHEKQERTEKQGAGKEGRHDAPFGRDVVAVEQRWWSDRSRMRALC